MNRITLILFGLLPFSIGAQSYIKTNPVRAALGEIHLLYQMPISATTSLEFKIGRVYYLPPLNRMSGINSLYGLVDYYDGYNRGFVFGAGFRECLGGKRSYFYQVGLDVKLMKMSGVPVLYDYSAYTTYNAKIDASHTVINPKFIMGFCNKNRKTLIQPYAGIGCSIRSSKITKIGPCLLHPTEEACKAAVVAQHRSLNNPSINPSIHVGVMFGLRTMRSKNERKNNK